MEEIKFWIIFVAALIPLIVGFIWYNPKTFGNAWMNAAGLTEEKLKNANMGLMFFLSYVFACLIAVALMPIVIHQMGVFSIFVNEPGFGEQTGDAYNLFTDIMAKYGLNFRTFKHGAFHGTLAGLFMALPLMATNALFERKSWKYIWINVGYWVISLMLMGGVICRFA